MRRLVLKHINNQIYIRMKKRLFLLSLLTLVFMTASAQTAIYQRFGEQTKSGQVVTSKQIAKKPTIKKAVQATNTYRLVSTVDSLAAGDKIIIVNEAADKALSTIQKTNNRAAVGVSASANVIVPSDSVQIITLEASGSNWKLNVGSDAYLYAASASSNYLKTDNAATVGDNGVFSIAITDNVATLVAQGDNTRNVVRYNPNSGTPIFSCYASSSTVGTLVAIYKLSIEEEPEAVPSVADIENEFDLTSNVVYCIKFTDDAEVCNDVRFVGTANNWGKGDGSKEDWDNCEKFEPLAGFDGWYVAALPYAEGFQGKPLQEPSDRSWTWDFQCGDVNAWSYVGGNALRLEAGYSGECNVFADEPGAYIYELKYWRNHKTPCEASTKHTYTITVYAPDACPEMKPAIIGDFNIWAEGIALEEGVDDKGKTVYTYSWLDDEDHSFKIKEASDTDWSNEIMYLQGGVWYTYDNFVLDADTNIVLNWSDNTKYRFSLCPATELTDPTNCAEAREAALSVSANNEEYNDGKEYTIRGYVTEITYTWSSKNKNMSFWMADTKDGGQVLQAFKCAIENQEDVPVVGDLVDVTGKLTKFGTTPEFAAGCTCVIIEKAPTVGSVLTVAEALAKGQALGQGKTSTDVDTIVGYVIAPESFRVDYMNQTWFMADDADAESAEFKAYNCFPIDNLDTVKVLAGDKVALVGHIFNYYDKNKDISIIEIMNGTATFISMVEGDRTIQKEAQVVTVAEAIQIGAELAESATSEGVYEITGYVSAMAGTPLDFGKYGNQNFWITDNQNDIAASNENGALYVWQAVAEQAVKVGDLIQITTSLKNYAGLVETLNNKAITILSEAPAQEPNEPFALDLTNVAASINAWRVENVTKQTNDGSKWTYDIGSAIAATAYAKDQPNVIFQIANTKGKTSAFNIAPGKYYEFSGKNGVLKVLNTKAGDIIRIHAAAKGSTACTFLDTVENTYPINAVALTEDLTLPAKETEYTWRTLEWISQGGDVYIKEIAAGWRVDNVTVVREPLTLRLANNNIWDNVYLYAWTESGELLGTWPGTPVDKYEDGWFTYTFENRPIGKLNIIWNNGEGAQTSDINVATDACFQLVSNDGACNLVDCSIDPEQEIVDPKYPIIETYFAKGEGWELDNLSSAAYDAAGKKITVTIGADKVAQWQGQVKLQGPEAQDGVQYHVSLKMRANNYVEGVTLKWQDDNNEPSLIYEDQSIVLSGGKEYVFDRTVDGIAGNGILVVDFGAAHAGDVIEIYDIVIAPVSQTIHLDINNATLSLSEEDWAVIAYSEDGNTMLQLVYGDTIVSGNYPITDFMSGYTFARVEQNGKYTYYSLTEGVVSVDYDKEKGEALITGTLSAFNKYGDKVAEYVLNIKAIYFDPLKDDANIDFSHNITSYWTENTYFESNGIINVFAQDDDYFVGLAIYSETSTLQPGSYEINFTYAAPSAKASYGASLYGGYAYSMISGHNEKGEYVAPFWFLQSGTVTVNEDGTILINAVNSNERSVTCQLGEPAPTPAYLAEKFDLDNNIVVCLKFDEHKCNEVVFTGSYNNWSSIVDSCTFFVPLAGFDDWYVVSLPYALDKDGYYPSGKPIELRNDGTFSWNNQSGDEGAWIYRNGLRATIQNDPDIPGEAFVSYTGPGAYIYEIAYWKNHSNPCEEIVSQTYTVHLYVPDACPEMVPAICGEFTNNWASNLPMNYEGVIPGGILYSVSFQANKGDQFKFREVNDHDWSNQLQFYYAVDDAWYNFGNLELGDETEVWFDYSNSDNYRFTQCQGGGPTDHVDVTDGSIAEWNYLPAGYVFEANLPKDAAFTGLKSMKVYADKRYINLLVEPDMNALPDLSWVPFDVFLNTDNSDNTGGSDYPFTDPNSDLLIEGGLFEDGAAVSYNNAYAFAWNGEVGASGWAWSELTYNCCNSQYVGGKFEIQIDRERIPVTWDEEEFGIGVTILQNWENVGILPLTSPSDENAGGYTNKLQVRIYDPTVVPITAPTEADLANAGFDVENNIVLAFHFDENTCNDIVVPGSYNGWNLDLDSLRRMAPLAGFDGWYAVELPFNAKATSQWDNEAKPVQLRSNGTFSWDYQAGGIKAWTHIGGNEAIIGGSDTECTLCYPKAGAYIYEVAYWLNHANPCLDVHHYYTIYFMAPDACPTMKPAICGDFTEWQRIPMYESSYSGSAVYYYQFYGEEGQHFFFVDANDSTNILQWHNFDTDKWIDDGRYELGATTDLTYNRSDNLYYRFAKCEIEEEAYDINVFMRAPAGAPDSVEIIGTFDEWTGKLMTYDAASNYWTATIEAKPSNYFKFRQAGTWDNEIQLYYADMDVWDNCHNLLIASFLSENSLGEKTIYIDFSDPELYRWTTARADSLVCYYEIEMTDSYGDGWNGGALNIIDGAQTTTVTLNSGSYERVRVPYYGNNVAFYWHAGNWGDEVGFTIFTSNGRGLFHHAAGSAINDGTLLFTLTESPCSDDVNPYEPQNITAVVNADNTMSVNWTPVNGAANYYITVISPDSVTIFAKTVTENAVSTEALPSNGVYTIIVQPLDITGMQLATASTTVQATLVNVGSVTITVLVSSDSDMPIDQGLWLVWSAAGDTANKTEPMIALDGRRFTANITVNAPSYNYSVINREDADQEGYHYTGWWYDLTSNTHCSEVAFSRSTSHSLNQVEDCNLVDHSYRPTNLKAVSSAGRVEFSWEAKDKADKYYVYIQDANEYKYLDAGNSTNFVWQVEDNYDGREFRWIAMAYNPYYVYTIADSTFVAHKSEVELSDFSLTTKDSITLDFTWKSNKQDLFYEVEISYSGAIVKQEVVSGNEYHHTAQWPGWYDVYVTPLDSTKSIAGLQAYAGQIRLANAPEPFTNLKGDANGHMITYSWETNQPMAYAWIYRNDDDGRYARIYETQTANKSLSYAVEEDGMYLLEIVPYVEYASGKYNKIPYYMHVSATAYTEVETFLVQFTATEGGYIWPQGLSGKYPAGKKLNVYAYNNDGYRFVKWSDGVEDVGRTYVVAGPDSICAIFEKIPVHNFSAKAGEGGSIYVYNYETSEEIYDTTQYAATVTEGYQVYLYARTNEGYTFLRWSDGETTRERTITVASDTSLTAEFVPYVRLTLPTVEGGSVNMKSGNYLSVSERVYSFEHGAKVELEAVPADGYKFVAWSDQETSILRSLVLTGDTTLSPIFEKVTTPVAKYIVTIIKATSGGEINTYGGTYQEGTNLKLIATPNEGYTFAGWSDGVKEAERTLIVASDTIIKASFAIRTFTLKLETTAGGTVNSAEADGVYKFGSNVRIIATPNDHFRFLGWSDGNYELDRKVKVVSDTTIKASFEAIPSYKLTLTAERGGKVRATGVETFNTSYSRDFDEYAVAYIEAQANDGYSFFQWSDGNTNAIRSITMSRDITLSATFQQLCQFTLNANEGGSVAFKGSYIKQEGVKYTIAYGKEITVVATPKEGYRFVRWNNGETDATLTFTITSDLSLMAIFEKIPYYAISVQANEGGQIYVTGMTGYAESYKDTLVENTTLYVSAAPNSGYSFYQWNDGVTEATRVITLTSDSSLVASFRPLVHLTIKTEGNGEIEVAGDFVDHVGDVYTASYGQQFTLTAVPADGYRFTGWSDQVTTLQRTVTLTSDSTLTARFEEAGTTPKYTVAIKREGRGQGSVNILGTFEHYEGDEIELIATAGEFSVFDGWSDGVKDATRKLKVESDTTLIASFSIIQVRLTISATEGGTVNDTVANGLYDYGTSVTITATPNEHRYFTGWSDGNKSSLRFIVLTQDTTIQAIFSAEQYKVTFVNYDGTILEAKMWEYGATPVCSITPSRPDDATNSYVFAGWDPEITVVTADATYTAKYTAKPNIFTVTFFDWDGTVLKKEEVKKGESATPPADPTREGYKFVGWDGNYTNVQRNEAVFAVYEEEQEAIDNIDANQKAQKVFIDGNIYIIRNGRIFTLTGKEVK